MIVRHWRVTTTPIRGRRNQIQSSERRRSRWCQRITDHDAPARFACNLIRQQPAGTICHRIVNVVKRPAAFAHDDEMFRTQVQDTRHGRVGQIIEPSGVKAQARRTANANQFRRGSHWWKMPFPQSRSARIGPAGSNAPACPDSTTRTCRIRLGVCAPRRAALGPKSKRPARDGRWNSFWLQLRASQVPPFARSEPAIWPSHLRPQHSWRVRYRRSNLSRHPIPADNGPWPRDNLNAVALCAPTTGVHRGSRPNWCGSQRTIPVLCSIRLRSVAAGSPRPAPGRDARRGRAHRGEK